MKKQYLISALLLVGTVTTITTYASPRRIGGVFFDLGQVHKVQMSPGMATLIEIPDAITGVRLGNPDFVEYFKPASPDNEITLVLKTSSASPTNLILRSGRKKYVFDLVPSQKVHQDTLEVVGAYGGPVVGQSDLKIIETSRDKVPLSKAGGAKR